MNGWRLAVTVVCRQCGTPVGTVQATRQPDRRWVYMATNVGSVAMKHGSPRLDATLEEKKLITIMVCNRHSGVGKLPVASPWRISSSANYAEPAGFSSDQLVEAISKFEKTTKPQRAPVDWESTTT